MIPFGRKLMGIGNRIAQPMVDNPVARSRAVKATKKRVGQQAASGRARGVAAGRSANNRMNSVQWGKHRRGGTAALAGLGAVSLAGGINQDGQVTKPLMNLTMGSPDFDEYATGRRLDMRQAIVPWMQSPVNSQRWADATRSAKYSAGYRHDVRRNQANPNGSRKNLPVVNGSIAFGMYNSRLG